MSQFFKVRNHLQSVLTALDNVEHGRMPLDYFEEVFEGRVESMRNLIDAERRVISGEMVDEI